MKENNYIRVRLSTIVLCILTILLCAAPCGARTVESGDTLNVGYGMDVERIDSDWLMVSENATVNLYPGAYVAWGIYAFGGSTVNIYAGEIGAGYFIAAFDGESPAVVTVYGSNFAVDKVPIVEPLPTQFTVNIFNGGVLTGKYENGDDINLKFFGSVPIYLEAPDPVVEIDIRPGGNPNTINLKSKGVVPVAVLTTDQFNADTINPATVRFADAAPIRWKLTDVDNDGDDDMLFHFQTQDLNLNQSSTEATLTGRTTDEALINGKDTVRIISPKK